MIPSLALANPSLFRQAMRSAAVNIPLGLTVVGVVAALQKLLTRNPADRQRVAFLKCLTTSTIPNEDLLRYMDAADPIDMAKRALATIDDATAKPLRIALAATF